jgi:hypothetical protein
VTGVVRVRKPNRSDEGIGEAAKFTERLVDWGGDCVPTPVYRRDSLNWAASQSCHHRRADDHDDHPLALQRRG